ncbi:MAG: Ig-like domain-containing protein [Bifidobacteriaceae bacterium]|nr:Ig-like domain-containing protein [Bifidobacteriaceae bacterium]
MALGALTPVARFEGLDALLDAIAASGPSQSGHTADSWARFAGALAQAQALKDRDPATVSQAEVSAAVAALKDAWSQLAPLPDLVFVDLSDAIAAAERLAAQSGKFTDPTWQAVAAALAAAKAVPPTAEPAVAEAALVNLLTAIGGLIVKPVGTGDGDGTGGGNGDGNGNGNGNGDGDSSNSIRDVLDSLNGSIRAILDLVHGADRSDYSDQDWANLVKAVLDARALLANGNATYAELTSVIQRLLSAYASTLRANASIVTTLTAQPIRVKVSQKRVNLVVGKALKLTGGGYNQFGAKSTVTWKSSKKKIVRVSQAGKVRALKPGRSVITARSVNGKKIKVVVRALKAKPKRAAARVRGLSVTGVAKQMKVGQVKYANPKSKPITAVSAKATYKSSNSRVLSVDKAGRILAKAPGTARIRITMGNSTGKKHKRYTIKVVKA